MKTNLKHPKELLDEQSNKRFSKIEDYFDRNPPELVEYKYQIKLTHELKDILGEMNVNYPDSPEIIVGVIADLFNKAFGSSREYQYKGSFLYSHGISDKYDVVIILTPEKVMRH